MINLQALAAKVSELVEGKGIDAAAFQLRDDLALSANQDLTVGKNINTIWY